MTGPMREPKAQRWPAQHVKVRLANQSFHFCIDLDPKTVRPYAVFVHSGQEGSDLQALASNVAILISVALQAGVPLATLARNLKRPGPQENPGWPALFVPALLDTLIAEHEAMRRSLDSAGLLPPDDDAGPGDRGAVAAEQSTQPAVPAPTPEQTAVLLRTARGLIRMARRAVRQARGHAARIRWHLDNDWARP